ncbi:hypothetical protein AB0395_47635 [Streptosporangium sp. NPDC051023]|uniref:hypothetical protein n=1 Tax=Streptosporangium sp. NPDC051023 TaxID=3155410 RepID=UPI00344BDB8A
MDPETGSRPHKQLTSGQGTWSARCGESRTPGAASGTGKRAGSNPGTAPRADSTGAFYRTALFPLLGRINSYLVRWIRQKYRRLKTVKKALRAYYGATKAYPAMFRHWRWNRNAWRTG